MTIYDLDTVFTFGKYKGETLREVFERNPTYVDYCLVNVDEFLVEDSTLDELREINPDYVISDEAMGQLDEKWNLCEADAYSGEDDFFDNDDDDLYGPNDLYNPNTKARAVVVQNPDDDDDGDDDDDDDDAYGQPIDFNNFEDDDDWD